MLPFLSLKLSVKHSRKHEAPQSDKSDKIINFAIESSHLPWFVNIGDRSWKDRTVPVGKRLAKCAVLLHVWLMVL
jgi:hypothetical protein